MDNLPISEQELAAMDLICRAATEGPWTIEEMLHYGEPGTGFAEAIYGPKDCNKSKGAVNDDEIVEGTMFMEDAEFIANARQNMPRLLAEVRRQKEEIAALKAELKTWLDDYNSGALCC